MLEIDSLFCGYDGKNVVKNLSFTVDKGERVAVLGPNGCGKTTLLRALAGIIPYRGAALIDGREVNTYSRLELSKRVALFSQISSVFYAYSAYDVVEMGRYLKRTEKKGIRRVFSGGNDDSRTVCKYLKVLGLWDIREKPITELSGGQLQRVMLARAFAQEPDILLLDEPTNHLDISYQLALIELIKYWAAEDNNRILIGVFHDLNLVPSLFDRVLLLKDGELLADGEVERVLKGEELAKAYDADVLGYMRKSGEFWT